MREILKTDTKVGIFVVVGIILLAVGTSLVGKYHWGKPAGYTATAVFGSVSGLEEKSPVRIAGVRVGEVEKIYLKDGLAYVTMRLQPDAVIREDSEVSVSSLGLLGEKYVEITSGSPGKPAIPPGGYIHGKELASMDKLISQFTEIAADIKGITASLRSFIGPEEEKSPLREIFNSFEAMAKNINEIIGENRQGVKDAVSSINRFASRADTTLADNQEDIRATVKNFRELSDKLQTQVSSLSDKLNQLADRIGTSVSGARQDFADGMREIKSVAGSINETFGAMKDIVEKAKRGEGTVGKLLSDEAAYENLNKALTSISNIAKKIERGEGTMGKLLTNEEAYTSFKQTFDSVNAYLKKSEEIKLHVGFRSEWLADSSDAKSYASLRISPRPDKFYLIEAVADPRGTTEVTDTRTTTTTDGDSQTVVTHEEKTQDKMKFSLLFGRRFQDIILRGGLMESTGGAGADYLFHQDLGRLSVDAWDFNRESGENPHLKLTAAYNVYQGIFLEAGLDDALVPRTRSFFLGAGLLWSDDDLKYILGMSGGAASLAR